MSESITYYRVRLTFGKLDSLRFVGHLDLAKTWERVLRRARMLLVYSQGFNPQPRMQLASALPLGVSSECELLDIWLLEDLPTEGMPDRLNAVSPLGLRTFRAEAVPLKAPALQTVIRSAEYRIELETPEIDLSESIKSLLAQDHLVRERRGKSYDLRPLILELRLLDQRVFLAHLALGSQGTARPDELVDALGLSSALWRCHRTALHIANQIDLD